MAPEGSEIVKGGWKGIESHGLGSERSGWTPQRFSGDRLYRLWLPTFCSPPPLQPRNHKTLRRRRTLPNFFSFRHFQHLPKFHRNTSLPPLPFPSFLSLCATFLSSSERRCRERPSHPHTHPPTQTQTYFPPSFQIQMASFRFSFGLLTILPTLILALVMPSAVHAQSPAPAPAPTSDGTAIDQGIAYVLMFLALVLTYLIHSADVSGF